MCICFLFVVSVDTVLFLISHFDKCLGNHQTLIQCGDSFSHNLYLIALSHSVCRTFLAAAIVIEARKCALEMNILAYRLRFVMARAIYRFAHVLGAQFKQAKIICPWSDGVAR